MCPFSELNFFWLKYAYGSYQLTLNEIVKTSYPTGRKFSFEFIFRYFANAKFAKFKFRFIFTNSAMIACINDFQISHFVNILTCEFDHSEPVCYIKFRVRFHPVGYAPKEVICSLKK